MSQIQGRSPPDCLQQLCKIQVLRLRFQSRHIRRVLVTKLLQQFEILLQRLGVIFRERRNDADVVESVGSFQLILRREPLPKRPSVKLPVMRCPFNRTAKPVAAAKMPKRGERYLRQVGEWISADFNQQGVHASSLPRQSPITKVPALPVLFIPHHFYED